MTNELSLKLFDKYPELFKHKKDLQQSLMGFGFECDDGWFPIIYFMCEFLHRRYQYWSKETQENFYVVQVKEKFGGLRFYMSTYPEFPQDSFSWLRGCIFRLAGLLEHIGFVTWSLHLYKYKASADWGPISDMEMTAESISNEVCEVCGKPGTQNEGGWIQTLCEEHRQKRGVE